MSSLRSWYYHLDPELRLIHVFANCTALKVAIKYGYNSSLRVQTPDDAKYLDMLVSKDGYKICHTCYNREQSLCRQEKREAHPGFRKPPIGWKAPEKRTVSPRAKKTHVERN